MHTPPSEEQKALDKAIRVQRARNQCERCGAQHNTYELKAGKLIKIRLALYHLDQDLQNNDPANLQALCQDCISLADLQGPGNQRRMF